LPYLSAVGGNVYQTVCKNCEEGSGGMMQMKNNKKIALIFVLSITLYGAWCIWDYFSLVSLGRLLGIWGGWPGGTIFAIPIIGIWMGWSGLWKIVNATQDWDRSVGYAKIIGGAALIIITNLFLYALAQ
jgi:hypothetical protein